MKKILKELCFCVASLCAVPDVRTQKNRLAVAPLFGSGVQPNEADFFARTVRAL